MFNRLKNRVLSAVAPDQAALPVATSFSQHNHHSGSGGSHHHHHHNHHHGSSSSSSSSSRHNQNPLNLPDKFAYARPPFLQLSTADELRASADHNVRPIIVPRDGAVMPWHTGYAECVNSGKSEWNEDQAAFQRHTLSHPQRAPGGNELPYIYFGTFDGHAGYGAALAASHQFHYILHEKLVDVIDMLMPEVVGAQGGGGGGVGKAAGLRLPHPQTLFQRTVSRDELIIGALESAFAEMDALLAEDRDKYRNAGGCTALVTLFILGKMFVANAGDSRAVLCQRKVIRRPVLDGSGGAQQLNGHHVSGGSSSQDSSSVLSDSKVDGDEEGNESCDALVNHISASGVEMRIYPTPFSFDHTPDTERARLLSTARLNPALMGGDYVAMEYGKRPQSKDLGTRILYRQGAMRGWAYKTLTPDDLRMPLVTGEGKRSRLLGTIGVTRGFGDHDLRALYTQLTIKPFLSSHPEVKVLDLAGIASVPSDANADGEYGVLVMATDGLWDVSECDVVARTVFATLDKFPAEKHRYTMVAQELVARARGKINEAGHWRLAETKAAATVDDISVLAVPVAQYYEEWRRWERECEERLAGAGAKEPVEPMETEAEEPPLVNGLLRMGETEDGEETIAVELEVQEVAAEVEADAQQRELTAGEEASTAEAGRGVQEV